MQSHCICPQHISHVSDLCLSCRIEMEILEAQARLEMLQRDLASLNQSIQHQKEVN